MLILAWVDGDQLTLSPTTSHTYSNCKTHIFLLKSFLKTDQNSILCKNSKNNIILKNNQQI